MRVLRCIATVILIPFGFQLFGQSLINDTLFFYQDSLYGSRQSIFIDHNKNNKFYLKIGTFSFGDFDNQSYDYSINYFKDNNIVLKKRKIKGIASKWVILQQYKGNFYLYHPCDFLFHYRVSITDTTFIDWTGEGPVANKIIHFKRIDSKTFDFELSGIYDQNQKLRIHIIDNKKGIAIFEKIFDGRANIRYLMADADKIRNIPIFVNNCEYEKQLEQEFDAPDYDKLLKIKEGKNF